MRELSMAEVNSVSGGMSNQCYFEGALNYGVTAAAIGVTLVTGGIAGFGALAGAALSWSSWYRNCGPAANYGVPSN